MKATTVETDSSHVPMLSQPDFVLDVIRKAVEAVQKNMTRNEGRGRLAILERAAPAPPDRPLLEVVAGHHSAGTARTKSSPRPPRRGSFFD